MACCQGHNLILQNDILQGKTRISLVLLHKKLIVDLEGKERSWEADGAVGEVGRGPGHLKHQSVTGILSCNILRCFQLPAKQDVGDAGAKDGEDDNANES